VALTQGRTVSVPLIESPFDLFLFRVLLRTSY
jgi:hypothetical protein